MRTVKILPYDEEMGTFWKVVDNANNKTMDDGFESSADAEMYCHDNSLKMGDTAEDNILIARFMQPDLTEIAVIYRNGKSYHNSWEMLMPVIAKIGTLETDEEPFSNCSLYSPIELVHAEAVDFIKQYNQ